MQASDAETLAVVVVNYGSSALLKQNLAPLSRLIPGSTIVVVDSFSTVDDRGMLRTLASREGWEVVEPETNVGFGGGVNLGVQRARELGARTLLLLNPDAAIDIRSVEQLYMASITTPRALVAPTILRPDGTTWSAGSDVYLDDGRLRSWLRRSERVTRRRRPWLSGACLMLSLELWDIVGGFDPGYFLYWEDVDFSYRVLGAGGELRVIEASATHAEGGTQALGLHHAGSAKSSAYYYYNIRNRLLFAAIHLTDAELKAWMRVTPTVAYEVLLEGGRRQFLHSLKPITEGFRGVRDGRRIARAALRTRAEQP